MFARRKINLSSQQIFDNNWGGLRLLIQSGLILSAWANSLLLEQNNVLIQVLTWCNIWNLFILFDWQIEHILNVRDFLFDSCCVFRFSFHPCTVWFVSIGMNANHSSFQLLFYKNPDLLRTFLLGHISTLALSQLLYLIENSNII